MQYSILCTTFIPLFSILDNLQTISFKETWQDIASRISDGKCYHLSDNTHHGDTIAIRIATAAGKIGVALELHKPFVSMATSTISKHRPNWIQNVSRTELEQLFATLHNMLSHIDDFQMKFIIWAQKRHQIMRKIEELITGLNTVKKGVEITRILTSLGGLVGGGLALVAIG